ncbi:MAG: ComF family protein [Opitutales bacterium]
MRIARTFRLIGDRFLDLVCPRSCLGCADLLEDEEPCRYLCSACMERIQWVEFPYCKKCGHPFFGELLAGRDCPNCIALNPTFEEGRVAFLLSGIGQSLVHGFKYRGITGFFGDLPYLLEKAQGYLDFLRGAVLVPVPLHERRRRARGYNQSALIAKTLANFVDGATYAPLLMRTRFTPTQTDLPRDQRLRNVKNAFAPKPKAVIEDRQRYVLIDDVITTGATLEACSRALRKAGAGRVDVAALGHG